MMFETKIIKFSNDNVYISYYEDKDGKKQNQYLRYFNDPHVIEEKAFYINDKLHGEYYKYQLVNGKQIIVLSCNYTHGLLDGPYKKYDIVNGKQTIVLSCNYRHGLLDKEYIKWCEYSGKPIYIQTYNDGSKNTHIEWYLDSGLVYQKFYYKDDKIIDGSKQFFNDGKLHYEWKNKEKTTYNTFGNILCIDFFDDDYNLTKTTRYIYNKIRSESYYSNGKIRKVNLYEPNITKTVDYVNKLIVVNITCKDYIVRETYNLLQRKIKTEKVNFDGTIIPSFWVNIKKCFSTFCRKINEDIIEDEMVSLTNQKID